MSIMKRFKDVLGDVCPSVICVISIIMLFGEIFNWMMYV